MKERFAELLRKLRKENNMTQSEVAKKINVSQRAYSFYENGAREPSMETMLAIAKVYKVSLDVLYGRYEDN